MVEDCKLQFRVCRFLTSGFVFQRFELLEWVELLELFLLTEAP
jgi:hypothetical protein